MSVVVIGSVFVDIKGYPLDTFEPTGRNAGRMEEMHGGVARNMVEDIANAQLRPIFLGLVDESGAGMSVVKHLREQKVNVDYMRAAPDGMGTWLAIFDPEGDVFASVSKRPNLTPIADILDEQGDEIFQKADSILLEMDLEDKVLYKALELAEKYSVPVYAAVSNMTVALQRRDLLRRLDCFVCNQQEAGILFVEDFSSKKPRELREILAARVEAAEIKAMVITMGGQGAVYAARGGESGVVPPKKVAVMDTTGAGDAFMAGVTIGLTYGKSLREACGIGTTLAAAVISSLSNVCPLFRPRELGLDIPGDLPDVL